jgi:hypothetical protein
MNVQSLDVDDLTGVERPRMRALSTALAVVLPVLAFVGAAALFVRSYVLPPSIAIGVPMQLASEHYAPASDEPSVTTQTARETTGSVGLRPDPPEPVPAASTRVSSVWDSVPIPAMSPAAVALPADAVAAFSSPASDPAGAAGALLTDAAPLAGPIPLPPLRPRFQVASVRGAVPMPRPRPSP